MSADKIFDAIKENDVKFVDLRFTDTKGKEQHVTIPVSQIDDDFFEEGKMFDGSSIAGWKGINESDMVLMPDAESMVLDPFTDEMTLNVRCDILEPETCKVTAATHALSPNVRKSSCKHQALLMKHSLVLNQSSSYLMMFVSVPI